MGHGQFVVCRLELDVINRYYTKFEVATIIHCDKYIHADADGPHDAASLPIDHIALHTELDAVFDHD